MLGGFDMAFYPGRGGDSIDSLAALQLLLFDEAPRGAIFLGSSNFFGSTEYDRLAGSFCKYLLENESVDAFGKLYRGLFPRHDPEMVGDAFQRFYEKPLDSLVAAWYSSISPIIAEVKAEVGAIAYDLTPVEVDLSTPETALESWYQALRKGDFDALISASTPELAELLREAKAAYEEEGILKEVVVEQFVYPYYPTTYSITQSGELGKDIYVFKINVIKDDEVIDTKDVPLRKIGGKWYIDVNP
jgi:hypothetical protein